MGPSGACLTNQQMGRFIHNANGHIRIWVPRGWSSKFGFQTIFLALNPKIGGKKFRQACFSRLDAQITIHLDSNNLNNLLHDFLTDHWVNPCKPSIFWRQATTPCNPLEVARPSSWVTPADSAPRCRSTGTTQGLCSSPSWPLEWRGDLADNQGASASNEVRRSFSPGSSGPSHLIDGALVHLGLSEKACP